VIAVLAPLFILRFIAKYDSRSLPNSVSVGVAHPPQPLPDVRRADARSAEIGGPDFISQHFQVRPYSGEPFTSKLRCNLLSNDDWRSALGDEPAKSGP
tara:strand:- start:541 stop:834 length:294 start_codon:yes stop_codon:yes gene_type:complete